MLLCAQASEGLAAQRLDPRHVVDEYLSVADRYASGDIEGAVSTAAEWDRDWMELALDTLTGSSRTIEKRQVAAAMMLHVEALVSQAVRPSRVDAHLRAARRLSELPAAVQPPRTFRRDWLLAMTWHLLGDLEFARAVPWLSALLGLAPDDGGAVATLAMFAEVYAWTPEPPAPLAWEHPLLRQMGGPNRGRVLDFAVRTYRRALDLAPSEAVRLRHARSLLAAERVGEAVPILQRLREGAADRDVRYMATLFLASAHQKRGQYGDAAAAYEGALALEPGCQTARVGLGAVLALQGRATEAARVAAGLESRNVECDDPWWGYRFGPPLAQRAQLLLTLRRAAMPQ